MRTRGILDLKTCCQLMCYIIINKYTPKIVWSNIWFFNEFFFSENQKCNILIFFYSMDKNQRIAHNHVKFLLNNDILLRNWNENAKSWKIAIYQISTNSWLKKNLIPIRILQKFCSFFWVIVMNYKVNKPFYSYATWKLCKLVIHSNFIWVRSGFV